MPMPMLLRIIVLVACVSIGAVLVRHITDALRGLPVSRQVAAGDSGR